MGKPSSHVIKRSVVGRPVKLLANGGEHCAVFAASLVEAAIKHALETTAKTTRSSAITDTGLVATAANDEITNALFADTLMGATGAIELLVVPTVDDGIVEAQLAKNRKTREARATTAAAAPVAMEA